MEKVIVVTRYYMENGMFLIGIYGVYKEGTKIDIPEEVMKRYNWGYETFIVQS